MTVALSHVGAGMVKLRRSLGLILVFFAAVLTLVYLQRHREIPPYPLEVLGEDEHDNEKVPATSKSHPIHQLITETRANFQALKARQSKTLEEAVTEYRRRYGIPPPPNFDKWYDFAKSNDVELIDEYDTIHQSLMPFWALEPSVIRERTREVIGHDNALIAVLIRDGQVRLIEGGGEMYEWQRKATPIMLKNFIQYLPDMDLAFNIHDEPRIVLQNDQLNRHIDIALHEAMPRAMSNPRPRNSFSQRPSDMNAGDRIKEYRTTRFNRYAHQPTWYPSRSSCPPDSAARRFLNDSKTDDIRLYTTTPLHFISNTTAASDICNTPSLRHSFGFFDRPNAFDVAHELIPIFSQSKVSSFQDILYPSPWYYMGKVVYNANRDMPWSDKKNTMYWRGSTTGGFSRDGGWRNQHRQQFVQRTMPIGDAKILRYDNSTLDPTWTETTIPMKEVSHLFDIHFTHIGQCDPGDCDAQTAFFETAPHVNMFDAFGSKYLLDIDGNAFSGRYYAWLLSHSLVYKLSMFREWHDEWIRPWVHYVPLSMHGEEHVEALRYFDEEEEGKVLALRLAEEGRSWAQKALRNKDLEVWYFRLLLEFGRLVDDEREGIGFAL